MVVEVESEVLGANSEVFAGLIADCKRGVGGATMEVENLGVFRDTIELMFEDDDRITKTLINVGVSRSIDILEVSAGIVFAKGVRCCLKYLEAVPWTEEEEEKLRSLFTRFEFDDATTRDILGRLYLNDSVDSRPNVAQQLVWSISTCEDANARNEMKSLVKGLLCKSSVYEKNHLDLSKEDLYAVCDSCLSSLISLFEEASDTTPPERLMKKDSNKPLIERISRQVDNINWLLEIMLDGQVAEDFVDIWAHQQQLLKMHDIASPMIRYELSRVSAILFVAMGTRKLQCPLEARSGLLQAWFGPMLLDFGWLQRCRKGLDMRTLEEAMGQTLLTLPLKQQYVLFMEWFRHFSRHGTECPNMSKAFQIWWRRSFLRGSETYAVESR
ncbi:BTB/POZ domain-containing protein [Glycine soja]|nr:BTB/POZ domain-containing protein [Glycine soja]